MPIHFFLPHLPPPLKKTIKIGQLCELFCKHFSLISNFYILYSTLITTAVDLNDPVESKNNFMERKICFQIAMMKDD